MGGRSALLTASIPSYHRPMAIKVILAHVIAAGAAVRLSCAKCAHSAVLPAAPFVRRHCDAFRLDQLERKGLCNRCGSREIDARPEYPLAAGVGGMSG